MVGAVAALSIVFAGLCLICLWDRILFQRYADWRGREWKIRKGLIKARGPYLIEDGEAVLMGDEEES